MNQRNIAGNIAIFDFDGTLAEFKKGVGPDIYSRQGYSRGLNPYANVVDAIKRMFAKQMYSGYYLCSAVLPYKYIEDDKDWWLDGYLGDIIPKKNRLYVPYGHSKVDALLSLGIKPGDVYIDDYNPNLFDIKKDIKELEPIKLVNDINDNSHEWRGAKIHYDSDPETIALTLYGLTLARREY